MLIIMCMFIFCGAMNAQPMCLLFYIFYMLLGCIDYVSLVGKQIQNSIIERNNHFSYPYYIATAYLLFVPFAVYWVFQAYQEFRGCEQDAMGGTGAGGRLVGGDMEQVAL